MVNYFFSFKGRFYIALFFLCFFQASYAEVLETATQDSDFFKYNPHNIKAPGFCIELMNKVQEVDPSLQIKIIHSDLPLLRIERELEDHRIDIFFCLLKSPEREKIIKFIPVELYRVQHVLVGHKASSLVIKNYEELKTYSQTHSVLVQQHSVLATTLKKHNVRYDDGTKDYSAMLKKLLSDRGDVLYVQDLPIKKNIKKEGLDSQVTVLKVPLKVEPLYVAYSKKINPISIKKVEKALRFLEKKGTLKVLLKKYADKL